MNNQRMFNGRLSAAALADQMAVRFSERHARAGFGFKICAIIQYLRHSGDSGRLKNARLAALVTLISLTFVKSHRISHIGSCPEN
jgi:hypothetical protein